jgi:hypothetical protein
VGSVLGELHLARSFGPAREDPPALSRVLGVSRDGQRLLVQAVRSSSLEWLDLEARTRSPCSSVGVGQESIATWLEGAELARHPQTGQQMRTRLHSAGVDLQGRLALVSRRGRVHIVDTHPTGGLALAPRPGGAALRAIRPFEDHPGVPGAGWSLRVATWSDGSRAFMDSRGLLHLQSARPGPEVTLALADPGPLAVWASDGGLLGPSVFTGVSSALFTSEAQVQAHLARFAEGIR